MPTIVIVASCESYRTGDFIRAARAQRLDVVIATDAESPFDDAADRTILVDLDEPSSAGDAIAAGVPDAGAVIAVDDQGVMAAAYASLNLGLPTNPLRAIEATRDKLAMRRLLFKLAQRLNNERDSDRLMEFAADIQTMQKLARSGAPTSDLVLTLIDEIGLAGSVSGLDATRRGMNRSAQGDDLTAVRHLAALHDDASTLDSWLRSRLAAHRSADGVVLATVHRVKGQEWPHVVVHHADAEQYPHRLAEDVEEERRLFHVAITRASAHVTIVPGPDASPFVTELTEEPTPDRVVSSHRPAAVQSASTKAPKKADPTDDLDTDAAARFDRLKTLRTELAAGKPAYVVFDNKTLAAIARTAPTTKQELSRISGVGPAKLDKYGDAFIELITTLV